MDTENLDAQPDEPEKIEVSSPDTDRCIPKHTDSPHVDNELHIHLMGLMQGLQHVARLQEELTNTQVDIRQKRREAGFKREAVWDHDARFMRELQHLVANGRDHLQADLERLEQLAAECQAARDVLGPLEHEGIEAERRWEGQIWSLRQAEKYVYQEFGDEFRLAQQYPAPPSFESSRYQSMSESESESIESLTSSNQGLDLAAVGEPIPQTNSAREVPILNQHGPSQESPRPYLGLLGTEKYDTEYPTIISASEELDSDSEMGDIDRGFQTWTNQTSFGAPLQLPKQHYANELYPQLLTEFKTKRERINKWLKHSVLVSHSEATLLFTILRDQLNSEEKDIPSNWAQLVIAHWQLDEAAEPGSKSSGMADTAALNTKTQ